MKKNIYLILILLVMASFQNCTPYNGIKQLDAMNELEYPYNVKMQKLSDGNELAYVDEGKGKETIIFIHGLGSYLPAWKKNISVLKDDYRCIAVDLPGYGKSGKNPHSGMMTFYADVLMEFTKKLGLEKVILSGHSMGGQISMVTAMHYPEKVKKVILVDPAGFERFHEGQKQWFRDVMTVNLVKTTSADAIASNLAYNFYNMPDDAEFMITDRIAMRTAKDFEHYCYAVTRSVHGMVDQPVIDKLENIKQPVLIFFGENDNLIPNRYLNPGYTKKIARYGHEKIQNSKLIIVPKCGHFMMFEKPEIFNREVKKFLEK